MGLYKQFNSYIKTKHQCTLYTSDYNRSPCRAMSVYNNGFNVRDVFRIEVVQCSLCFQHVAEDISIPEDWLGEASKEC